MVATAKAVVCLCAWLTVCQVRGSYIPKEMNKTIQNLLQHYKLPPEKRFSGKPVFSRHPVNSSMEVNMVYMSSVLEMYENLIGSMLEAQATPSPAVGSSGHQTGATAGDAANRQASGDVRTQLNSLLKKVQRLRKEYYQEEDQFRERLQAVRHIQTNDSVIQSKALRELPWLYEEASLLPGKMRRRRRRRQAHRGRTRP